jgi:hypothetical protein
MDINEKLPAFHFRVFFMEKLQRPVFVRDATGLVRSFGWREAFLMASMAATFYFAVTTPAVGPSTVGSDLMLAIFLVGTAVYLASYYYNKNRGIDLNLIYSVIPPD